MIPGRGEGRSFVGNPRLRRLYPADSEVARRGAPDAEIGVAATLDLLEVAFAAGMSVPGALEAVGQAVGGARGGTLAAAGAALALGAGWSEAWAASRPTGLGPVADALRATWEDGAPPRAAVRAAASTLRRERHAGALEAAARLGVRLVLPLGLCYLPAFVLVGLVPVVVSMAAGVLGR